MSPEVYLETGRSLFDTLKSGGGNVSPSLERHFYGRVGENTPRVLILQDPVSHLTLELAKPRWLRIISDQVEFANFTANLLSQMLFQIRICSDSSKKHRESRYNQISTTARRLVHLISLNPTWSNHLQRKRMLLTLDRLPHPSLRTKSEEFLPVGRDTIKNFLDWADRLESRYAPKTFAGGHNEAEEVFDGNPTIVPFYLDEDDVLTKKRYRGAFPTEKQYFVGRRAQIMTEDSALTKLQACCCQIEPAGYALLLETVSMETSGKLDSLSTRKLLFRLFWMIEIFHGIPFTDSAQLGLQEMTRMGQISESHLILNIGSGYYPAATDAWEPKALHVPLASECASLLKILRLRQPDAKKLGDFRHHNLRDEHRREVRSFLKQTMPGYKGYAIFVTRLFEKAARIELDLPSSEIGLLRGKPLPGARGEAAYISITEKRLIECLCQIQNKIRQKAGLTICPSKMEGRTEVFGTTALNFSEFWSITNSHLQQAKDHNSLVALVVRVQRALGKRNSKTHGNPWRDYRDEPLPVFEFRDKVSGGWHAPRYVWLSPALRTFVETCHSLFSDLENLPYSHNNRPVLFKDLPQSEFIRLQTILRDRDQYNSGRTALYNALLEAKAGEVPRQVIMGHGPAASHIFGSHLVINPRKLLTRTSEILAPLYDSVGVNDFVAALCEKMLRYIDPKIIEQACEQEAVIRVQKKSVLLPVQVPRAPRAVHNAPTYEEIVIRRRVYGNLSRLQFGQVSLKEGSIRRKSSTNYPLSGSGLLGLLALDLGLPLKSLINFQRYYTWDSFVINQVSGEIFFLVAGRHEDVGGLFRYPVFVCHVREIKQNRLMRSVRYLLARALRRQRSRTVSKKAWKSSVLGQSLFGEGTRMAREVGKALKLLSAVPDERCRLSSLEAFAQLNRVAETTCALQHPGLVSAVLSGRSMMGLNHFNLVDLFSFGKEQRAILETLLKTDFADRFALTATQTKNISIGANPVFTQNAVSVTSEEWFIWFKSNMVAPSYQLFFKTINRNVKDRRRSSVMASQVLRKYARHGLLKTGRPLPLWGQTQWEQLAEQVTNWIRVSLRPQLGGRNARLDGITKEHLVEAQSLAFQLCTASRTRPKEIASLTWDNIFILGSDLYIHVPKGKTPAARRTIPVGLLSTGSTGHQTIQNLVAECRKESSKHLFSILKAHYRGSSAHAKNLSRYLRLATGRPDLTIYDLRHNGLIQNLHFALKHRLIHGNFQPCLCFLSNSVGHEALSITLNTYLGTAVFALNHE